MTTTINNGTTPTQDPFDTALITRLTQEFFSEQAGNNTLPAAVPGLLPVAPTLPSTGSDATGTVPVIAIPGWPAALQTFPASAPGAPGLAGGYPSATPDAHPPVHPGLQELSTQPTGAGTPSGEHTPGSDEAYPFGEPRCNGNAVRRHHHTAPSANQPLTNDPSEVGPLTPDFEDAYAFGGPHYHGNGFDWRMASNQAANRSFTNNRPSVATPFPGYDTVSPPDYYFLHNPEAGLPASPASATPSRRLTFSSLNVEAIRRDFPTLHQQVNGHPLIWLDNAATTQKPQSVIDATSRFYSRDNSNIHRAAHTLAARSTEHYETGREKVRGFIHAADAKEIVFVRGTTEAINLVANTYGRARIGRGDEILLTTMEHHANIVPWQMLAQQVGATIKVAPINEAGELILDGFAALLNHRTKLVAVTHVSNALGTVNPVEQLIALAHSYGVPVLVDGAQSTPHMPIDVQAMDCDFFVFSGHKIFGPTGIGVLYGKAALLEDMPPWQGGGNMIQDVTFTKTTYQGIPQKFEAGTQDIAGVVGLSAAIDYLTKLGMPAIAAYEHELLEYATQALASVGGLRPIGTASHKASVLSFVLDGFENEEVGRHLDRHGIAVRSGHHCAQPTVRRFGFNGTVRPSLAFYNTHDEIDALVRALHQLKTE